MRLVSNPRAVAAPEGLRWLPEGIRLMRQYPLAWFTALMVYWAIISFLGLIPVVGMVISLLIAPALALGFVALAHAMATQVAPRVDLLWVGLKPERRRAMLQLGMVYGIAVALLVMVVGLVAPEVAPEVAKAEPTAALGFTTTQLVWGMVLYIPILMAFWFSPQLVMWQGFGAGKAIFYSFFAVWLNRGAFLFYAASWAALGLVFAAILALVFAVLPAATPGQLILAVLPASLLLMAVGHGSVYASTVALFAEGTPADPAEPPATPPRA